MLRTLLLVAIGAYTVGLAGLEVAAGPEAVRPYLLDATGPPFAHVQATLSLALLLATAILLGVAGRVERLSGRQTPQDRWIGAGFALLLVAVAVEDRFRLLPAWTGGSATAERTAWLALAVTGSLALIALSRTRLGRGVPRAHWVAGAAGFGITFVADAAGGTPLVVEDLPRIWGAAFFLLAAARMAEDAIAETALAGPAGSAWELGVGLVPAGCSPPVPRLTELARSSDVPGPARASDAPGSVRRAPADGPLPADRATAAAASDAGKKRGIRPEDECPEPDRAPLRASAAPPRKLLSH